MMTDPLNAAQDDLNDRWRVPPAAQAIARAMIEAAYIQYPDLMPEGDEVAVLVGLALPGKDRGVWRLGQAVEQAPGFFLARDDEEYARARDLADRAAEGQLAGRPGTTSYGVVGRRTSDAFEGVYGRGAE